MSEEKYIVRYKASDKPNEWRHFQKFVTWRGLHKIKTSVLKRFAEKLDWEESQEIMNEIKKRYDYATYHSLEEIEIITISGTQVSRFEIMDI